MSWWCLLVLFEFYMWSASTLETGICSVSKRKELCISSRWQVLTQWFLLGQLHTRMQRKVWFKPETLPVFWRLIALWSGTWLWRSKQSEKCNLALDCKGHLSVSGRVFVYWAESNTVEHLIKFYTHGYLRWKKNLLRRMFLTWVKLIYGDANIWQIWRSVILVRKPSLRLRHSVQTDHVLWMTKSIGSDFVSRRALGKDFCAIVPLQ